MSDATILATIAACKGGACAGQIERAAAAPHFFNFAAVCRLESVRELGEAHPAAALARLLAYGTLADALALPPGALPASFAPGAPAFRKAQVVSLQAAALSSRSLSYDAARAATGARGDAELEALVLEAAYAGLLDARLDQRERRVAVAAAAGRGVPPGDATALDALARDLARWRAGIGGALDAVARTADAVAAGARAEGAWAAHVARAVDAAAVAAARAAAAKAAAADALHGGGGGGGGGRAYGGGLLGADDDEDDAGFGGGGEDYEEDAAAAGDGRAQRAGARGGAGGGAHAGAAGAAGGARAHKRRAGPTGGVGAPAAGAGAGTAGDR